MKQDFCVMPFINLHIGPDGAVAPCCEFDGSIGELKSQTLAEIWDGEALGNIREHFSKQQPVKACWKCFDREANEKQSLRQQMNERFSVWHTRLSAGGEALLQRPETPRALDVRFSNLCNFKCRSCWHGASSKWYSDAKALGLTVADSAEVRSFDSVGALLGQLSGWIDGIESIVFAGGEPLLIEEHYQLLAALLEAGRSDVCLRYNTNMSVTGLGDWSVLDLWPRFDDVQVQASVDDKGVRGALIRHGFDWSIFVKNIQQVRSACPHVRLEFGITVSALNIAGLQNLFEALRNECNAVPSQFFLHSLQVPVFMRTQVLPPQMKGEIAIALQNYANKVAEAVTSSELGGFLPAVEGIVSYMLAEDLTNELPNLAGRMDALDALRHESSSLTLPELNQTLQLGRGLTGLVLQLKNKASGLFSSRSQI